jgi:hypothetical protein
MLQLPYLPSSDIMLVKLSEPSSAPVQDLNFDRKFCGCE